MVGVSEILNSKYFAFNDGLALNLLLLIFLLSVISLFIYGFYKSTSKRNLIELNLSKYNRSSHPFFSKLVALIFYFVEYIVIMPFLILMWFAALSFMLLIIAGDTHNLDNILLTAAIVIGAVRVLAYFKGDISKNLAQLFPFTALSMFILGFGSSFDSARLFTHVSAIPNLLGNVFSFMVVIFFVEITLRIIYNISEFWMSEEEVGKTEDLLQLLRSR